MSRPLHIVADAHIWGIASLCEALSGYDVRADIVEQSEITPARVQACDILLTRSSTQVGAPLLTDSRVRFAGTATIGDDHYDKAWLEQHGICWANAAGSSTDSVVEYILAALLQLHAQQRITLPHCTLGIIGAGRIGGQLAQICRALGLRVLVNDPPRARREGAAPFCTLEQLLDEADLLTLHTPRITSGEDCTIHLLNDQNLPRFRGNGVINSGRGACVDNRALQQWLDGDRQRRFAVLDCWEHEPAPDPRLLHHPGMVIATPHIAGHSIDGKAANSLYIYRALCRFLQIESSWSIEPMLPPATPCTIEHRGDAWQTLLRVSELLYPIMRDHQQMRSWPTTPASALVESFTHFRRHYPVRRSWSRTPVTILQGDDNLLRLMEICGIHAVPKSQ